MWFMIRYAMAETYGFVGGSMRALTRRNLVRAIDIGRKLDKADHDYIEPIVTRYYHVRRTR